MVNRKKTQILLFTLIFVIGTINPTQAVSAQRNNPETPDHRLVSSPSPAPKISFPGPFGGSANDLAIDPKNPNTLYAASDYGVFKSLDGGDNWAITGLSAAIVYALGIDPINSNNVFAGTRGNGFFKSANGGTTWTKANSPLMDGAIIYTIAVDPVNPMNIYAGGRGFNVDGFTNGGFWGGGAYKSTDGGSTWAQINNGLAPEGWVYSLVIDPSHPNIVYAGNHSQGVYKSFDGGATWVSRNGGMSNYPPGNPNADNLKIRSLSINPQNPNELVVAVWGGNSVFKTENGAENGWANISKNLYVFKTRVVKIDPVNPSIFYAGFNAQGVYKNSQSGDGNWNPTGIQGYFQTINVIVVNPVNDKIVYIAVSGSGIFRTVNGGTNWAAINKGFSATTVSQIAVDSKDPAHWVAATFGSGLFQSHDRGATWSYQIWPGQWDMITSVAIDPITPGTLYIGTDNYGMAVSTDNGGSWNYINHNLPISPVTGQFMRSYGPEEPDDSPQSIGAASAFPIISSVAAVATTPETLFAGTSGPGSTGHGAYYSLNGGIAWYSIGYYPSAKVTSIQAYPNNPNMVLITTANQAMIQASFNGSGYNTANLSNGLGTLDVESSAIDDLTNPATLYAGTKVGIYRSADNGASWALIGLPGVEIISIVLDKQNKNHIFAGSITGGVFMSNNSGATWSTLTLPNTPVNSMFLEPAPYNILAAGTSGGSVALIDADFSTFIINIFIKLIPPAGQ